MATPRELELQKQLDALKAKLAEATKPKALTCKVTEKGGVSVYGLGRFPVTLYAGQWERLAPFMPTILAFIEANADLISRKD